MKARILVVDDEPGMVRVVQRILAARHEVSGTTSAREALGIAALWKPDVAILDLRMPEMDGFELTSRLKREHPGIDVILMTGSVSDVDAKLVRAVRENAFYFVQKPFDREVLTALVARCLELRRLAEDNRLHVQRLESELSQARVFQKSLLPAPTGSGVEGVSIAWRYDPCSELGGDLLDHASAGPGRVSLLVADVSGHGVSAAMLTGVVKSAFRSSREEAFDPLAVVGRLWDALGSFGDERFVTLVCGVVDVVSDRLDYVNAGHPPPFVWRPAGPVAVLPATGPLVSAALPGLTWRSASIPFPPESRLLLYSDGIVEASGEDGFFGEARLVEEIDRSPEGGPVLLDGIVEAARRHVGGRPRTDDWTLLLAHRGRAIGAGGSAVCG